jgi:hypothetical protein
LNALFWLRHTSIAARGAAPGCAGGGTLPGDFKRGSMGLQQSEMVIKAQTAKARFAATNLAKRGAKVTSEWGPKYSSRGVRRGVATKRILSDSAVPTPCEPGPKRKFKTCVLEERRALRLLSPGPGANNLVRQFGLLKAVGNLAVRAWFKVGYHSVSEVALVPEGRPESSFPTGGGGVPGGSETNFPNCFGAHAFGQESSFP